MKIEKIDKLLEFKKKNKLSKNKWKERGLEPSNNRVIKYLNEFFNHCTDKIINSINSKLSNDEIKYLLQNELKNLNIQDFDTEEKELICDLFKELASLVNIDFNNVLDIWLYGFTSKPQQDEIVETLNQPCAKCEIDLKTHIIEKQEGIPDYGWVLAKCNNCGELNLLTQTPNIKRASFENYQWLGTLYKDKYNIEQAFFKLEKIKLLKNVEFKMSW